MKTSSRVCASGLRVEVEEEEEEEGRAGGKSSDMQLHTQSDPA